MKDYLRYIVVNGVILTALLVGSYTAYTSLATFAIVILWLTSIIAPILYIAIKTAIAREIEIEHTPNKSEVPKWLDAIFDTGVTGLLVYLGYPVLAIFYAAHIYFLWRNRDLLEKLITKQGKQND